MAQASEHLAEKVTSGEMTQTEADEKLAEMETTLTQALNGEIEFPVFRNGRGRGRNGKGLDALSEATGIDNAEIREQLQAGITPAQFLTDNGVDVDQFIADQVAQITENVNERLAAGQITQEEADARLDGLAEEIAERLNSPITNRPERNSDTASV